MNILSNLTFIVNTKNRHEDLKKMTSYYKDTDIKILIYDVSNKKIEYKFDKNIKYFYTPGLTAIERVKLALDNIETPFVAIHHDDDFYLISSLKIALAYLIEDKNISAVGGIHYSFRTFNKNIYSNILNKKSSSNIYEKENLFSNLDKYISRNDNTLVSIILRKSDFINIENLLQKNNLNKYFLREVCYALAIFTIGNAKKLDLPFFFRNENNYSYRFDDPCDDLNDTFYHWYKSISQQNLKILINRFYLLGNLKISKELYEKKVLNFFKKIYDRNKVINRFKKLNYINNLKTKISYYFNAFLGRRRKNYRNRLDEKFILSDMDITNNEKKTILNDFNKLIKIILK